MQLVRSVCLWERVAIRRGVHRVLVVGDDRNGEPMPTADGGVLVEVSGVDAADQLAAPFAMACLDMALSTMSPERRRAAIHQAAQHLDRGGVLVLPAELDVDLSAALIELGMTRDDHASPEDVVVYHRSERTTVHDLLWDARATIGRVAAGDLAGELGGVEAPLVIDTRTHTDRCRMGVIAGSIHVPRTVLEWHLDPANGYAHPAIAGFDDRLVVVCNGGYSSSLAAANLVRLGFTDVRDLIGGVRAWIHHGHPVEPPDHAHLDL